jgi:hypothetical protein
MEDVAWSYEQPLPPAAEIAGLIAFWDHRVDVFVGGELRGAPAGAINEAMHDEFGV